MKRGRAKRWKSRRIIGQVFALTFAEKHGNDVLCQLFDGWFYDQGPRICTHLFRWFLSARGVMFERSLSHRGSRAFSWLQKCSQFLLYCRNRISTPKDHKNFYEDFFFAPKGVGSPVVRTVVRKRSVQSRVSSPLWFLSEPAGSKLTLISQNINRDAFLNVTGHRQKNKQLRIIRKCARCQNPASFRYRFMAPKYSLTKHFGARGFKTLFVFLRLLWWLHLSSVPLWPGNLWIWKRPSSLSSDFPKLSWWSVDIFNNFQAHTFPRNPLKIRQEAF